MGLRPEVALRFLHRMGSRLGISPPPASRGIKISFTTPLRSARSLRHLYCTAGIVMDTNGICAFRHYWEKASMYDLVLRMYVYTRV